MTKTRGTNGPGRECPECKHRMVETIKFAGGVSMDQCGHCGIEVRPHVECDVPLTVAALVRVIDRSRHDWSGACHVVSLGIVRSGVIDGARVARGWCDGVRSQHSWIVVGDPYDRDAPIVDPTLWAYRDDVRGIWVGTQRTGWHVPHGAGSIWEWGRPGHTGGDTIDVDTSGLSERARDFLAMVLPLDWGGWNMLLAHAPVNGWPAAEITEWADDQPELRGITPIDRLGMLTDRNPNRLYLP